jgi:hypothetical protein
MNSEVQNGGFLLKQLEINMEYRNWEGMDGMADLVWWYYTVQAGA